MCLCAGTAHACELRYRCRAQPSRVCIAWPTQALTQGQPTEAPEATKATTEASGATKAAALAALIEAACEVSLSLSNSI